MKVFWVFFVLVLPVFGGEREVWYGADGKAVRVIEDGEEVKERFVPQWERREVDEAPREGVIQWDRRSRYSGGVIYPVHPGYFSRYPRWHGGGYYHGSHRGHHHRGHGYHGGYSGHAGWGWSGVRIRIGH